MKLLFVFACLALPATGLAAKPKAKHPPSAEVRAAEDAAPRTRKPGFWERAWESTKKGTSRVWGTTKKVGATVTSPLRRGEDRASEETAGWGKLSMSMTLDPATVKIGDTRSIKVIVGVVNAGKQPTQLEFPNTQRIEVLLKAAGGKVISKWSEDQKLDEEQGFLVINPGERLEYAVTISTRDMAAGETYLVEAYFPSFDQLRTSRTVVPTK